MTTKKKTDNYNNGVNYSDGFLYIQDPEICLKISGLVFMYEWNC